MSCASNPGIAELGDNKYLVSRQASTGFSGLSGLKIDAIREAGEYCISQGKSADIVSSVESQPPYILGNYPRAEVTFSCN